MTVIVGAMPTIVSSRIRKPHQAINCPYCKADLEFLKPTLPANETSYKITCCSCNRPFDGPAPPTPRGLKRRIGTDANPIDLTYYNILNVPITADANEIKSAYRRLALKKHPDKMIGVAKKAEAEEEFKVSLYLTLISL